MNARNALIYVDAPLMHSFEQESSTKCQTEVEVEVELRMAGRGNSGTALTAGFYAFHSGFDPVSGMPRGLASDMHLWLREIASIG